MTDLQIYSKLSGLPPNLKMQASGFIDFLKEKSKGKAPKIRIPGKARGLIIMKDNFEDPIE